MKKNLFNQGLIFILLLALYCGYVFSVQESGKKLPSLIPRQVLFGNPVQKAPLISPNGTQLSYLAPSEKGVTNIWVRNLGEDGVNQVTQDKRRGIHDYLWALDSQHLIYLQDSDGDENEHVYIVDLGSRNIRDLTPFQGVKAVNLIVENGYILVGLNLHNRQIFDMYKIDYQSGKSELDTENPGSSFDRAGS